MAADRYRWQEAEEKNPSQRQSSNKPHSERVPSNASIKVISLCIDILKDSAIHVLPLGVLFHFIDPQNIRSTSTYGYSQLVRQTFQ